MAPREETLRMLRSGAELTTESEPVEEIYTGDTRQEAVMSAATIDNRPTRGQVRAAQMIIERYERGVGPKPSDAVRRLAKAIPRD